MINLFLRLTLQRLWCNRTAKVVKIKKLSTIGQEFFCYFYLLSFRLTLKSPHAGASLQLVLIIIELAAPHAGIYALSCRNLELAVHTQAKRRQRL